ncbi:MAG TPA: undecaprenyl-diphosphate phosphatase, partial [Saprospiraceae bacterium]|nr:undecaprenyl-diphosphate phosphatase [Saprospiraceae bacterium]
SLYDVYKNTPEVLNTDNLDILLVGNVVSFVVAFMAIKYFIEYLTKHGFRIFGIYRIILGALILILHFAGVKLFVH